MHKGPSSTVSSVSTQSSRTQGRRDPSRKVALWVVMGSATLLMVAWIDGGEEPIHLIEEPIAMTSGETP